MALLTKKVDLDTIHLVGRQRSETMLRYTHMTSKSFTEGLDVKMFHKGDYTLIPPVHAVK